MASSATTFTANTVGYYGKIDRYVDGEPVGVNYAYKQGMPLGTDLISTGGNKLASVNVTDLFRVYPELAPTGYFGHYYDDEDRRKADQEFAKNILLAAEHNAGKKALNSLPKIKKNKEDK